MILKLISKIKEKLSHYVDLQTSLKVHKKAYKTTEYFKKLNIIHDKSLWIVFKSNTLNQPLLTKLSPLDSEPIYYREDFEVSKEDEEWCKMHTLVRKELFKGFDKSLIITENEFITTLWVDSTK